MKTGDRETEDAGTPKDDGTSPGTDENVIRLPREWIGPLEELVPIRPAPPAGQGGAEPVDGELPPAADAFWSEDAGALHNAVRAPVESSAGSTGPVPVTHGGGVRVARPIAQLRGRWDPVRLRQLGVAAVAVPLVALALIGTLWGSGGGRAPTVAGRHRTLRGTTSASRAPGEVSRPRTSPRVSRPRTSSRTGARRRLNHGTTPGRGRAAGRPAHARATAANSTGGRSVAGGRASSFKPSGAVQVGSSTTYSSPSPVVSSGSGSTPTRSTVPGTPAAGGALTGGSGTSPFGPSGALGPGSSPNS